MDREEVFHSVSRLFLDGCGRRHDESQVVEGSAVWSVRAPWRSWTSGWPYQGDDAILVTRVSKGNFAVELKLLNRFNIPQTLVPSAAHTNTATWRALERCCDVVELVALP